MTRKQEKQENKQEKMNYTIKNAIASISKVWNENERLNKKKLWFYCGKSLNSYKFLVFK